MRIDLNKYTVNKPFIKSWRERNLDREIGTTISILAVSLECPCIAVAFYIAEDLGFIPEIIKFIDRQVSFYGYSEITNQQENSPYLTMDPYRDSIK